jgi:hypothetical protein
MVSPRACRRRLSLARAALCLNSSGTVTPPFRGTDISQNRVPSSAAKLNLNRVSDILPIFRTGLPVACVGIEAPVPLLSAKQYHGNRGGNRAVNPDIQFSGKAQVGTAGHSHGRRPAARSSSVARQAHAARRRPDQPAARMAALALVVRHETRFFSVCSAF